MALRYASTNDQEELENDFDPDKDEDYYREIEKKIKWYDQLLLNRPLKVVLTFLILAMVLPTLVYHYVLTSTLEVPASDGYSTGTCLLPRTRRIPCGVPNVTHDLCHNQCCYDEENGVCFHRLPSRFSYLIDRAWNEFMSLHPRVASDPFARQPNVPSLRMVIDEVSATHVTFEIYDPRTVSPHNGRKVADKLYEYEVSAGELDISVYAGNRTLLEMDRGPLVAAEDIWELSFRITNETMYGLEEIPLLPGTTKVIYGNRGSSSPIPLIFARSNGSFHGLMFGNESPTEVQVLPENHLLFRTITDEHLKFHVFVGPTPEDIMRDVMLITGGRPEFPYWMLGPHFCSENTSPTSEQYAELTGFLADAAEEGLPLDSHCGVAPLVLDIDQDEESLNLLRLGAAAVTGAGGRFVPHLSPYIKHNEPEEETIELTNEEIDSQNARSNTDPAITDFLAYLIKDSNTAEPYLGLVGDSQILYPDYSISKASEILRSLWPFGEYSGIVLENNWPLDESEKLVNETYFHLPYFSKAFEEAFMDTLPWNSSHANPDLRRKKHLHHHNTYGELFIQTVRNFTENDDLPLWSTSQWMNTKIPSNRQHVSASWATLRRELVIAALGGVSGNWLTSSPICGDTETFDVDLQAQLCVKWYLAATYLPLFKVHSKEVRRDPLTFQGLDRHYMLQALNRRLSLLPYISTVLQGGPLLRPMFYQYPDTEMLHDLTSQFAVGDALLVVPNVLPLQTLLNVWLPPGVWYEMWSGLTLEANAIGIVTMPTAMGDFFTLVSGGHIVVLQEDVRRTSEATRLHSSFSFIVALDCKSEYELDESAQTDSTEEICYAEGQLVLTNDMSLIFTADSETLTITAHGEDWGLLCDPATAVWARQTKNIKVYGLHENLNNFDTYLYRDVSRDLCEMQITNETVISFV